MCNGQDEPLSPPSVLLVSSKLEQKQAQYGATVHNVHKTKTNIFLISFPTSTTHFLLLLLVGLSNQSKIVRKKERKREGKRMAVTVRYADGTDRFYSRLLVYVNYSNDASTDRQCLQFFR